MAPSVATTESQSPAGREAVFGNAGDVLLATGWDTPTHAGASYRIEITNKTTGFQSTSRSNSEIGQYGAALLDVTNAADVRPGDELTVLVKTPSGTSLGDAITYQVTAEDVKHGYARVDVAVSHLPVFSLLHRPFPEPVLEKIHIRFQLARKGRVTLRIFDVSGRLIDTLQDEEMDAGYYKKLWNGQSAEGRSAASGVYYVRLQAPDYTEAHRITLIH